MSPKQGLRKSRHVQVEECAITQRGYVHVLLIFERVTVWVLQELVVSAVFLQVRSQHVQEKFLARVTAFVLETLNMCACVVTDGWELTALCEFVHQVLLGLMHQQP